MWPDLDQFAKFASEATLAADAVRRAFDGQQFARISDAQAIIGRQLEQAAAAAATLESRSKQAATLLEAAHESLHSSMHQWSDAMQAARQASELMSKTLAETWHFDAAVRRTLPTILEPQPRATWVEVWGGQCHLFSDFAWRAPSTWAAATNIVAKLKAQRAAMVTHLRAFLRAVFGLLRDIWQAAWHAPAALPGHFDGATAREREFLAANRPFFLLHGAHPPRRPNQGSIPQDPVTLLGVVAAA
jgi:hypothetical protein